MNFCITWFLVGKKIFSAPVIRKSMIKYHDIFSPLAGSKEETREWLREKSGEFCDHKIQKIFFTNYKYVIHRTWQSRSEET